ncbi:hypothetical protein D3C80_1157280 [compost metagenome]
MQRVELVGINLVHHGDERIVIGDQQPGLPIGREIHVAFGKRLAEGATDGLLPQMLHVKRGLALPLRHQHAGIESPKPHHVFEANQQFLVRKQPRPRPDSLALMIENADDRISEIAHAFRCGVHLRARHGAGLGYFHIGEIRLSAGPHRRLWNMQAEMWRFGYVHSTPPITVSSRPRNNSQRFLAITMRWTSLVPS